MKTSSTELVKPKKGIVRVGGGNKAGCDGSEIDSSEVDGGKVRKKVQKTSNSKNLFKSKKMVGSSNFFTLGAKLAFTKLRQTFFKALILYYFNPECHIWIEINTSYYVIDGVFSQLILES